MLKFPITGLLGTLMVLALAQSTVAMAENLETEAPVMSPAERALSHTFLWQTNESGIFSLDEKSINDVQDFLNKEGHKDFIVYRDIGTILLPMDLATARKTIGVNFKNLSFEPDGVVHGFESVCADEDTYDYTSAPPTYNQLWGLKKVWNSTSAPPNFPNAKLAVWIVDSGVDLQISADNELDVASWRDCTKTSCDPISMAKKKKDRTGHGTFIAGIIGAKINSTPKGIIGVAPGAKINSLRVFEGRTADTNLDYVLNAVTWLYTNSTGSQDNDATTPSPGDVVNLSLGSGWNPETLSTQRQIEMMIKKLANQKGLKISIAAGNIDTLGGQGYVQAISPARAGAFPLSVSLGVVLSLNAGVVMTASGINSDDTFWDYSAFGNFNRRADGTQGEGPPDFAEPASDLISLWPGKELARCSGTSFAAAHLSGLLLYDTITTSTRSIKDPSAHKPGTDPSNATNYDPNRLDPIGVHQ